MRRISDIICSIQRGDARIADIVIELRNGTGLSRCDEWSFTDFEVNSVRTFRDMNRSAVSRFAGDRHGNEQDIFVLELDRSRIEYGIGSRKIALCQKGIAFITFDQ